MKPLFFALLLALAACTTNREKVQDEQNRAPEVNPGQAEPGTSESDSILIPEFRIEIKLSERATERLKAAKETIIVSAYFSGEPRDGSAVAVNEMGEVALNTAEVEIEKPGIAQFNNVRISKEQFANLSEPDYNVSINVFSGRRSTNVNLLNCDILEQPISEIQGKVHAIGGKLIEEQR